MGIDKKEVEHVADLSRLKLSEAEKEKFTGDLRSILAYVDKLKELKVEGVKPAESAIGSGEKIRPDQVVDFKDKEKILKNAPKTSTNFIEVKGVFK